MCGAEGGDRESINAASQGDGSLLFASRAINEPRKRFIVFHSTDGGVRGQILWQKLSHPDFFFFLNNRFANAAIFLKERKFSRDMFVQYAFSASFLWRIISVHSESHQGGEDLALKRFLSGMFASAATMKASTSLS